MDIAVSQINDSDLTEYGLEVVQLLRDQKYSAISEKFSYALAFGKNPSDVIKEEINSCLSQAGEGTKLNKTANPRVVVKYFKPNDTNLVAVVECYVLIDDGNGEVLAELIVTGSGEENDITLEQISYSA